MTTTISVSGRLATVTSTDRLVAGNTYPVTLALDSEWTGSLFMRVRFGSQYYDIPFASSDTTVDVQFPVGYPEVGLGVFSEALEICSNEVRVRLLRSILEQGVSVVDFDSDLYDQWAGEVSELLCDDDFDAESERPVKNSVLTAWKDTVPLDADLVHKTGNEEIAGRKTFTGQLVSAGGATDRLILKSTVPYGAGDIKSYMRFVALGEGGTDINYGTIGLYQSYSGSNPRNVLNIQCTSLTGDNAVSLGMTNLGNGRAYAVAPSFTEDNAADTKIMTRAMLASTPTIVHTTGTETIAGDKTLTGMPTVSGTQATLDMASTTSASTTGWKAQFRYRDQSSLVASTIVMTGEDSTQVETRVYKPDRSNYYWMRHTAYSDHELLTVQPYYPVDGSGNPQPLTAGALVSSGNIAVDPRIVHTTGNETIAGVKTFTDRLYGYRVLSKDTSAYGTGNAKCGIGLVAKGEDNSDISYAAAHLWQVYTGDNKRNSFSINVKSLDGASESSIELWKMADNSTRLFVPSHTPVDGSGNHLAPASGEAMTSVMIAVDPRIVHTTGNEEVAGNKTFKNIVNVSDFRWSRVSAVLSSGAWLCVYRFKPNQYGSNFVADICNDYDVVSSWGWKMFANVSNSPNYICSGKLVSPTWLSMVLATRTDGDVEVWVHSTRSSSIQCFSNVVHVRSIAVTPIGTTGNEPVVGDKYTRVVLIQGGLE